MLRLRGVRCVMILFTFVSNLLMMRMLLSVTRFLLVSFIIDIIVPLLNSTFLGVMILLMSGIIVRSFLAFSIFVMVIFVLLPVFVEVTLVIGGV